MPPRAAVLIQRLIESRIADDEVAELIAAAFERWLEPDADPNLTRHLGIPGNRDQFRREMRDAWLIEAAKYLDIPRTKSKAGALLAIAQAFERRKWPIWRCANFPPVHATELEARLFYAMRTGAPLPTTKRRLHDILQCKS